MQTIDIAALDANLIADLTGDTEGYVAYSADYEDATVANQAYNIVFNAAESRGGIVFVGSGSSGATAWTDAPPACSRGDWLMDEITGLTEVGGWSKGPISWPRRKKTGTASLLLTGELVRAVRVESSEAIAQHWGVCETTVWRWRQALGVGKMTEGTRHLMGQRGAARTDDAAARGREAARAPEALAKMAASKRGKPVGEATLAGLLEAASRPKGPEWGARANAWMLAGKRKGSTDDR